MPIVLSVNGTVETYPPVKERVSRSSSMRRAIVGSNELTNQQQPPAPDHSFVAAKQAYRQQTQPVTPSAPALLAQDLMSTPVISLPSDVTLVEAWTLIHRKGIHHLPVTSLHGVLVGMVSDRDLVHHRQEAESTSGPGPARSTLAHVMETRVFSATPATEIREIARVMLDERIDAMPILDGARHVVGILTISDLLRAIVHRSALELWT